VTQPTLHRGKLAKTPRVLGVRPLTREDMLVLQDKRPVQNRPKALRETHHRLARMVAAGMRTDEILRLTGFSYTRYHTLKHDPAFTELVTQYRGKVDEAWERSLDEVYETETSNLRRMVHMVADHLDEAEETNVKIPLKELFIGIGDRADRFGYSKKIVNRNENLDFAKMMEQVARASGRSNVIDAKQQFVRQGATLIPDEIPASRLVTSGDDGGTDG
jgi:hypothetical protein